MAPYGADPIPSFLSGVRTLVPYGAGSETTVGPLNAATNTWVLRCSTLNAKLKKVSAHTTTTIEGEPK